jgi:hypothetical protein
LVIDAINRRFRTSFTRFEHTEENVKACFSSIERRSAARFGGGVVHEEGVARPSGIRQLKKASMQDQWTTVPLRLRQQADQLFERLVDGHAI